MVWGGEATLINISVSNGNLICHRMIIPAAPNQGVKVIWMNINFSQIDNMHLEKGTVVKLS